MDRARERIHESSGLAQLAGGRSSLFVRSLIRRPPAGIDPNATLREAATAMDEEGVGCLAIWAEGRPRRAAGVITERDLVAALADGGEVDKELVWDHMTDAPVTVDPTTYVGDAARMMVDGGFRHLPVSEDGETVGIISFRDLLFAALEESSAEARLDWSRYLSISGTADDAGNDGG